jgi:hypothetical protein
MSANNWINPKRERFAKRLDLTECGLDGAIIALAIAARA